MEYKKKLIEVALPLEAINTESAREKSIRHGHPSTLHLWWARRPLATARAVIWASLVDDPSSHPDLFPSEEMQQIERERLFGILLRLVKWENSNDPSVLYEAKNEIMRSTNGTPPALLDPFAGGGAIPLEAQRLGLEAHAHDLNPVAVMINKAMIEIPPRFANQQPVNQESRATFSGNSWTGAAGLAEDVHYYGEWLKRRAFEKIGHLYPKVKAKDGHEATVIAWIWARTIKCPNPACLCSVPLMKSFVLSKKAGNESYLQPSFNKELGYAQFDVKQGKHDEGGTVNRKGAICPFCNTAIPFTYIRTESIAKRVGSQLVATVADGKNGRIYLPADREQENAAKVVRVTDYPTGDLAYYPGYINPTAYGYKEIASLFSDRQLNMLCTLSDLLSEVKAKVQEDAEKTEIQDDPISLSEGGRGALAYSEAVVIYLAFLIDKMADYHSTICSWNNSGEKLRNTFGLTGMSMSWDYAEANPFSDSSGSYNNMLAWVYKAITHFKSSKPGSVRQFDAQSDSGLRDIVISTDPPYYSNVPYADFADFFFIWLRRSLRNIYPSLFNTMLTPKAEELTADPYLRGGKQEAAEYFENGMSVACKAINLAASEKYPVTIYYAFKQSEAIAGADGPNINSTGWETMLNAIINSGFTINGTWPMRTEMSSRSRNNNSNALASSIVLVCRKRSDSAGSITRREFINALHREMRPALEALQSANIAPVDLAQSAIGPGIGVFSRYKSVVEADGASMSVRAALQIINQELDAFYNEQEGELDAKSRFCVDIFNQYAFNTLKFGDADVLARAKNTSVQALVDEGVMEASKGSVRLKTREEIPEKIDGMEDCCWKITQQLAHAMEKGGIKETATIVSQLKGYIAENAKQLAYRLYTICERKNWAAEGYAYNNLIVAWPDIQSEAARMQAETPVQMNMFDTV